MINAIPRDLKIATGSGIGMFLAIIGLREMGWIQDDGATLVNLATTEAWVRASMPSTNTEQSVNGRSNRHYSNDGKRHQGRYHLWYSCSIGLVG